MLAALRPTQNRCGLVKASHAVLKIHELILNHFGAL
jgi:hypothetical protein